MSRPINEYPEILAAIAEAVAEALIKKGKIVSETEAAEIGIVCADKVRHSFGGDEVYIPKAMSLEYTQRDLDIQAMLVTATIEEVCKKYGITRRRVYQILKAVNDGIQKPEQLTFEVFGIEEV